jgi:hypothetical protein
VVLQWCYSGVSVVSQKCDSGITIVLRWCYSGVTVVSRLCYKWFDADLAPHPDPPIVRARQQQGGVVRVDPAQSTDAGRPWGVTGVLLWCYTGGTKIGVVRVLQEC